MFKPRKHEQSSARAQAKLYRAWDETVDKRAHARAPWTEGTQRWFSGATGSGTQQWSSGSQGNRGTQRWSSGAQGWGGSAASSSRPKEPFSPANFAGLGMGREPGPSCTGPGTKLWWVGTCRCPMDRGDPAKVLWCQEDLGPSNGPQDPGNTQGPSNGPKVPRAGAGLQHPAPNPKASPARALHGVVRTGARATEDRPFAREPQKLSSSQCMAKSRC